MCESVELARILDVRGTLLKTTCRQNSAIASLSIMAKIRMPEKIDPKMHMEHMIEKRNNFCNTPSATIKMSGSSIASSSSGSSSYSSSPETNEDCNKYVNDIDNVINSVKNINIHKSANIIDNDDGESDTVIKPQNSRVYQMNIIASDDEKSDKQSEDEDEDNEGLIERGPVRPQLHTMGRPRPYLESSHYWTTSSPGQQQQQQQHNSENSTDFDTMAKEIMTDRKYREKIDFCLDKLSDMSQECNGTPSLANSLSPAHSDFGGTASSGFSPPQQQQWQTNSNDSPASLRNGCSSSSGNSSSPTSSCYVPSITVCDSESSLLEILSRGGFQPAQQSQASPSSAPHLTPEYNSVGSVASSSLACASDNWPDSPASSYNNCTTSASRPDSRASSRAQSPGSNNGCSGGSTFLNVLGSPMGSPQVPSSHNFRNLQRPSSTSSSSQSYCETPSPANYQNPMDQHLEQQLDDDLLSRFPALRDSYESSDTLVNSESSELQLQLVDEVIRNDLDILQHASVNDVQVVPNCASTTVTASQSLSPNVHSMSPSYHSDYSMASCKSQQAASPEGHSNYSMASCKSQQATSPEGHSNYSMASCKSQQATSPGGQSTGDHNEPTYDLVNTLLKFVGSDQAIPPHRKVEARSGSSTSGYSSGSSGYSSSDTGRTSDTRFLPTPGKSYLATSSRSPPQQQQQQQQQQTVYQPQQYTKLNTVLNVESRQFTGGSVELSGNAWQNQSHTSPPIRNPPSNTQYNDNVFQIPETVASFNSQRSHSSTSKQNISDSSYGMRPLVPWPSLNLPATEASKRLKEATNPHDLQRAMVSLLAKSFDELTKPDNDGDTPLMCLVGNPLELRKKLAYLVPLVERLCNVEGALWAQNNKGEDALYLAAMNSPEMAFVAGYLAAKMLQMKFDISQRLYRSTGDTLVHALAAKGDSHGEVLAELLSLRTKEGNSVYDLARHNYDGRTALHVATEAHDSMGRNGRTVSIGAVKLLLENGADPGMRESRCGDSALHLAISLSCDPALVKALLMGRGKEAVNLANYNGNTPLHMAAVISERTSLERQSEICLHLIQAGGRTNLTNRQGKTPLALVSAERKEALRRIFHKKL